MNFPFSPYSNAKSRNIIKLVKKGSRTEINVKILQPVSKGHLNIADTFFRSQWHSLYRGSIEVALVHTELFNKHFKMPNRL